MSTPLISLAVWSARRLISAVDGQLLPYCPPNKTDPQKIGCVDNNNVFPREVGNVTEFDIGEFFIRGEAREVEGEFQAVIVMRAKPPLKTVTYHQVEKDRWFKTPDVAAIAAQESARELKAAVDAGALKA
ncbi:hypothetical protein D3C81_1177410 [compost metagenome]